MNLFGLLGAAGRGVGRGLRTVGQQIGQGLSGAAGDDELLRQSLPPSYDGSPNPASRPPLRTAGAGNLAQAAGIPLEARAGNQAAALGMPDTGGGVLIENARPAVPQASPYDRLSASGPNPRPPNPYSINKERDFRPAIDPALMEMRFPVSPYSQTTPVDPVSAKLYAKDAAQPFNPDPDPYEAAHKSSVAGRYLEAKQGGKWKGVLRNAALGALQGIQNASRNPYNDWRALLAGAAGGAGTAGVLTAANDEMGAELGWEMLDRPRYEQERARKYGEYQREAEQAKTLSDIRYNTARTEAEERRNLYYNTPNETIDVRTGLPVPGTAKSPTVTPHYEMLKGPDGNPYYRNVADPANQGMPAYVRPTVPSETATRREIEEGMTAEEGTIEQISNASLEGRKQVLYQSLPAPTRMILEKGQVVEEDYTRAATPAEVQRAYNEWQDVQAKELTRIKAETKAEREKKVGVRTKARRPANTSTAPRTLDDVMEYLR